MMKVSWILCRHEKALFGAYDIMEHDTRIGTRVWCLLFTTTISPADADALLLPGAFLGCTIQDVMYLYDDK